MSLNEHISTTTSEQNPAISSGLAAWLMNPRARAMAICLTVGGLVALILSVHVPVVSDLLLETELSVQDMFSLSRAHDAQRAHSLSDDIILVRLDADSARRLGLPSQVLPRRVYAQLLQKLESGGAKVVGFDLPLDGPSKVQGEQESAQDDRSFAEALRKNNNIVLSCDADLLSRDIPMRMPSTMFVDALGRESGSVGNAAVLSDHDHVVRHMPLVFEQFNPNAFFYKSFALRIAEKERGSRSMVDSPDQLFLQKHTYPTLMRINYVGPPGTFKVIPLWRALDWEKHIAHHGLFLPSTEGEQSEQSETTQNDHKIVSPFQDKIVLVGTVDTVTENREGVFTGTDPLNITSWQTPVSSNTAMSSIELQANVLSNLLHDLCLNEPELWHFLALTGALSLCMGRLMAALHNQPYRSLTIVATISVLWIIGAYFAFCAFHALIPIVVPIGAVILPSWALSVIDADTHEKRERRKRTRVFRSLAAKPLAQEIERKLLQELGLDGKRMVVTVLACQMRGFTNEGDNESAEEVMQRLNSSLSIMMACIAEHRGLVERIWNCGLIGIWGAPIAMAEEEQARLAASCALSMRKRLFDLSDSHDSTAGLRFNFSCGINTGESVCGTINATTRDTAVTQYGALGPAVDLAVDLEALNLKFGTTFILGQNTAELLGLQFELRDIDRMKLGAGNNAQSVYELLPWEGSLPGALEEAIALFKQGRRELEEGRLSEAEQLFSTSLRMVPHDKPTMLMLERCRELMGKAGVAQESSQTKLTLKERLSEGRE